MKSKWSSSALGLLLVMGIGSVLMTLWLVNGLSAAVGGVATQAQPAQMAPAQSNVAQVAGNYNGVVKLQFVVAGVYSATLATPPPPAAGTPAPPDLGSIDLALPISQTGSALTGYVNLDKTLVFSAAHTLQNSGSTLKIGPYVNGSFDGTNLTLFSEKVATTLSGKAVQRQFRLTGAINQTNSNQLQGEYRETIWGVARQPVTVLGKFTLNRPLFVNNLPASGNKPPIPITDTVTTRQATPVTINVLANDTDANGDVLTITAVSKPQFGTATTNGKTVTYTPNPTFIGKDSFSYFVSDGKGGTAASFVTVTVSGPNDIKQALTATNDTIGMAPDTAVSINVLNNDTNPDGNPLLITLDSQPSHGTAVVQNGQVLYTPQTGYTGSDAISYIISDGMGETAAATVEITVGAPNQPSVQSIYLPLIAR